MVELILGRKTVQVSDGIIARNAAFRSAHYPATTQRTTYSGWKPMKESRPSVRANELSKRTSIPMPGTNGRTALRG